MSADGDQARSATPTPEAKPGAGPQGAAPQSAAAEQRVHLYEAVSTRRDQALDAFSGQRAAILKAVADQREAALAPIRAVQAKQTNKAVAAAAASGLTGAAPMAGALAGDAALGGKEDRRQSLLQLRRSIADGIVATIRTLVAAEVRAQLAAALPQPIDRIAAPDGNDASETPAAGTVEDAVASWQRAFLHAASPGPRR